ncbi:MAG: sulfite exporter TauE/SafE family protein [Candidatus Korobacteraceae bacterium]
MPLRLHLSQAIFLFFAAIIGGTLNALAGGGTFVTFPALLSTGIPAVQANATNTVALWPGLAASTGAYLKRLSVPRRLLVPLLLTSVVGGLAGSLLLLKTPQHVFLHLIPWLLLSGTLLFAFGNNIRAMAGKSHVVEDLATMSWRVITATSIAELLVAIYGGYFGAGIGFILLGMLAALGMRDIHAMGAIRTLLSVVINAAAVLTFILARAVFWPHCLVMIAGAMTGGWFGAHYAQKADPRKVRGFVIAVGLAMSAYYFVTVR